MTNSNELDTVSNSWDQHSPDEHGGSTSQTGTQVAQAAQAAPAEPVPVDVGSGAPVKQDAPAEAKAPAAAAPHEYVADASNVVKLPADVSIDNIKVDGHNLVLEQADGSVIVIKDGALNVPTFIIGDVEVPRVALLAALEASHVDVAFGADGSISAGPGGSNPSAGGDFSVPPGGIGDGFDLSALLPPTALQFGLLDRRELFPSVVDRPVSVVATSLLAPDEAASETGLNGGPSQSPGSDAPSDAETSGKGTITIDAPDGIGSIVINGVTVIGVGQHIPGDFGYLTIVSFNPNTGAIEYNYTVTESVTHPLQGDGFNPNDTVPDNFSITVTDVDGDTASTTFAVAIVDDVPTAVADTDSVTEGGTVSGNVIAGLGGDGNPAGADTKGADDASVSGATGAGATTVVGGDFHVVGQYGTLTLSPDGTYSYVANSSISNASPVTDTFTYTLKDGDGDTSQTTLAITIADGTDPSVLTNAVITVDEAGLGTVNATGSAAATNVEDGSGTVSFHAGSDNITGVAFTSVAGITADVNGVAGADFVWTLAGPTQIIGSINGIDAIQIDLVAPSLPILAGTDGSATVNVTLLDNFPHPDAGGQNVINLTGISVVATDTDGDQASATVQVNVVDDVPTAVNDGPYAVVEDGASTVSGNVLTNDASGADTPKSFSAWSGGDAAAITALTTYGTLTQNANGTWSYVLDNSKAATQALTSGSHLSYDLHYTMTDADGDTSPATLTITIDGANDSASVVTAQAQGADNTVYEAGLNPNGSNALADTETSTGSFTISATDGIQNVVIGGTTFTLAQVQAFAATNGVVNTGEGVLTLTGYTGDAHTGTVAYSYTLTATIDNDSKAPTGNDTVDGTGFNDSVALTVNGVGGTTASDNLVVHVVDDVPTAVNDGPYAVVEDGASTVSGNV
ncbi:VCBS domain-containing protein, partial [Mesorhizobium sp. M0052]